MFSVQTDYTHHTLMFLNVKYQMSTTSGCKDTGLENYIRICGECSIPFKFKYL